MARSMTKTELIEFYELNRRLFDLHAAKGEHSDSQRLIQLMSEIEKHLYRHEPTDDSDDLESTAQP